MLRKLRRLYLIALPAALGLYALVMLLLLPYYGISSDLRAILQVFASAGITAAFVVPLLIAMERRLTQLIASLVGLMETDVRYATTLDPEVRPGAVEERIAASVERALTVRVAAGLTTTFHRPVFLAHLLERAARRPQLYILLASARGADGEPEFPPPIITYLMDAARGRRAFTAEVRVTETPLSSLFIITDQDLFLFVSQPLRSADQELPAIFLQMNAQSEIGHAYGRIFDSLWAEGRDALPTMT